jgi:hypothetical protein
MSSATVTRSASKPQKAPPEKKIGPFSGGVGVTIWLNRIESDQGPRFMRSITLNTDGADLASGNFASWRVDLGAGRDSR